eukprot:9483787-Pyramimonas_sp.AAC.1
MEHLNKGLLKGVIITLLQALLIYLARNIPPTPPPQMQAEIDAATAKLRQTRALAEGFEAANQVGLAKAIKATKVTAFVPC